MKTVWRVILWVIISGATISCTRHFYDVSWHGLVIDSQSQLPVPFANIESNSYIQGSIDNMTIKTQMVTADNHGAFNITFDKGYKQRSTVTAHGYKTANINTSLMPSALPLVVTLKREDSANVGLLEVRVVKQSNMDKATPFIGVKLVNDDLTKYNGTTLIAFDLINGKQTDNEERADIWIDISHGSGYPIICANKNGGLFIRGVSDKDKEEETWETDYAPEDGYQQCYRYTGNENRIYVKCRDGIHYAQIVLDNYICIVQTTEKDDINKKVGLRFSYVVQHDLLQSRYFPEKLISSLIVPEELPYFTKADND